MPEVKSRKIIFVKGVIDAAGKLISTGNITGYTFQVGFEVDDIIITGWSTDLRGAADRVYTMNFDGIGEIFHFRDDDSSVIKNVFRVGKYLDGLQIFTVFNYNGDLETTIAGLTIIFTVECIEFHK
jgi:hypothetical protein